MDEKTEYKGYTITIEQDLEPESPREWSNLGIMACWHTRYDLGDEVDKLNPDEFNSWNEVYQRLIKDGELCVLPLFLYDHSGISISTNTNYPYNDRWDAGQVGFIYTTKKKIMEYYGVKRISKKTMDKVKKQLVDEVETYNQYLTGDVYGYTITKAVKCRHCGHVEQKCYDSCWGFYGYKGVLEAGKSMVDGY